MPMRGKTFVKMPGGQWGPQLMLIPCAITLEALTGHPVRVRLITCPRRSMGSLHNHEAWSPVLLGQCLRRMAGLIRVGRCQVIVERSLGRELFVARRAVTLAMAAP